MKRLLSLMLCLCLVWAGLTECRITGAAAEQRLMGDITELQGYTVSLSGGSASIVQFQGDDSVENLKIPGTLEDNGNTYTVVEIVANAFYGRAANLKTVTIPGSVTSIGAEAFGNCRKLAEVRYDGMRNKWEEQVTRGDNWDGGNGVEVICRGTYTVYFRVENGSWDDGTDAEKKVTVTGYEDELKLKSADIPAAGNKPGDGYKAGSWDKTPDTGNVLTEDVIYTYAYAEKENTAIVYGDPVWSWKEDYSSAQAAFTPTAGGETKTVEGKITSKTTDATCTKDGRTVYTASVTFNGKEYTDEKTVTIPQTGHKPGIPARENEVAAGCVTKGSYEEAVYCETCKEEISREKKTIAPLGHQWGKKKTLKASFLAKGKIYRACERDSSHQIISETIPKIQISGKTKCGVNYTKLRKKKQTVKLFIKIKNSKGKITYTLVSAKKDDKSYKAHFKMNKILPELTVQKGLKKGTYEVTIKVSSSETKTTKKCSKKLVFKITIK